MASMSPPPLSMHQETSAHVLPRHSPSFLKRTPTQFSFPTLTMRIYYRHICVLFGSRLRFSLRLQKTSRPSFRSEAIRFHPSRGRLDYDASTANMFLFAIVPSHLNPIQICLKIYTSPSGTISAITGQAVRKYPYRFGKKSKLPSEVSCQRAKAAPGNGGFVPVEIGGFLILRRSNFLTREKRLGFSSLVRAIDLRV